MKGVNFKIQDKIYATSIQLIVFKHVYDSNFSLNLFQIPGPIGKSSKAFEKL